MGDEKNIPNKPKHRAGTDRLQHALFESDNSNYKGNKNENKNKTNEKKDKE